MGTRGGVEGAEVGVEIGAVGDSAAGWEEEEILECWGDGGGGRGGSEGAEERHCSCLWRSAIGDASFLV